MAYTITEDEEFTEFAKRAEEEANNSGPKGNFSKSYDPIKWVGLESKAKIFRIVGGAPASMKPGSHSKPTDAHEIFVSKILDDNGNRMKLKLPLHAEDPAHEHIMWRIINKVNEVTWVKNPVTGKSDKKYKYADNPWFDRVNKGGYAPTDQAYQYSKGWRGQQVIIMNVIDREDNWCKENKHTKLLSKKINVSTDGTEYPEDGVPSFGFCNELSKIVTTYGSWERYDVQIRRTGQKTSPIEVKAASIFKKSGLIVEIDKDKAQYVLDNDTLTPEELEYERYDISKFFAPTTYQKILSKLGNTIKGIDADLRTNYYNELQALADKEKKEFDEIYKNTEETANEGAQTSNAPVTQAPAAPVAETPVASRAVVREAAPARATGLTSDKIALLKGWNALTDEEKAAIVDVVKNPDGTLKEVIYREGETTVTCPTTKPLKSGNLGCGFPSPEWFTRCPVCGEEY